jgi:hypothetical protein
MKHKILIHFFLTLLFIFVIGQQKSFSQHPEPGCYLVPDPITNYGTIHVYGEIPFECICVCNGDGTKIYCTTHADSNGNCWIKVVCDFEYSVRDPGGSYPSGDLGFKVRCGETIDVTIPAADPKCECSNDMKTGTLETVDFSLAQNYPNPFNPVTKINYYIALSSDVRLTVYDLLGNEIALLVSEFESPGAYSVDFDGSKLSSGVYVYKIQAGIFSDVKRLLLIK